MFRLWSAVPLLALVGALPAAARASDLSDAVEALRKNDYPAVVVAAGAHLAEHADDARGYAIRSRARIELKQFDDALADANAAIKLRSRPAAADLRNRGRAYAGLGKLDEALSDLSQAVELAPGESLLRYYRGQVRLTRNEFQAALADLDRAVELDPQHAPSSFERGRARYGLGFKEEVRQIFQGNQPAVVKVMVLVDRRPIVEGIADFTRTLQLDPNHLSALEYRELGYRHLGEAAKQLADARAICRLRPDDFERANHTAWELATHPDQQVRDGAAALELAEKACALTKNADFRMLDTLAAALAESKKFRRAVDAQQQAIGLVKKLPNFDLTEFEARLNLYRRNTPYHRPAPTEPANKPPQPCT